jgi:hypothetical protein
LSQWFLLPWVFNAVIPKKERKVLSPAETALHTQLYLDFLRLKAAGHRVQFRRARLFVDGQLWSKARGPAPA